MENYKIIDFDIKKAKTVSNPNGLDVVTKYGDPITIVSTNFESIIRLKNGDSAYPILAVIHKNDYDLTALYSCDGKSKYSDNYNDLRLKESISQRRMTNRELSKWLRNKPEEYREYIGFCDVISSVYPYCENEADVLIDESIMIRSNYGKWIEPLVDEEDFEL